jgi:hypothetical protein
LWIVAFLLRVSVASSLALAVIATTASVRADEPCTYDVEIFTAPTCGEPIGVPPTFPAAINAHGDVAGHYWQCAIPSRLEAFVRFAEGAFFTIPRPPGVISMEAIDLNDSGQVTGTMEMPTVRLAFRWTNGTFETLPPISDCPLTEAVAVNADGVVAANRRLAGCNAWLACTWAKTEQGTSIVDIPSIHGPSSVATDIDDAGTVVGWMGQQTFTDARAFVWNEGQLTIIEPPEGYYASVARAVRRDGESTIVAGVFYKPPAKRGLSWRSDAFLWTDGQFVTIPTPEPYNRCVPWDVAAGPVMVGSLSATEPLPPQSTMFRWTFAGFETLAALLCDRSIIATGVPVSLSPNGDVTTYGANAQLELFALVLRSREFGDLDGDGIVGPLDLSQLVQAWGPTDGLADLNRDAVVDGSDLALLLGAWTS